MLYNNGNWNHCMLIFYFTCILRTIIPNTTHSLCSAVRGRLNVHCVGSYNSNWIHFLVMFSQVLSIDSTCFLRTLGLFSFSLVLILRISRIPGDKGGPIFFRLRIFFKARFTYKLVYYNLYHVSNFTQNCLIFMRNWM